MPKYVIERTIPGAGRMNAADLCAAARKSNGVLHTLGPDIQWVQSYVTGDKIYCVYIAPSEELIREHAQRSGFPVDSIARVQKSRSRPQQRCRDAVRPRAFRRRGIRRTIRTGSFLWIAGKRRR